MSFQSTKKIPSRCRVQCPDCEVTLFRRADMNRHRKTRHPDGTETKFPCPWPGCPYKTMQKGNLKAHIHARHSNRRQYPCPECDDLFGDAAARIRHRKKTHGYKPYHTEEYYARQALRGKGDVVQGARNTASNASRQQAASGALYSLPNAPSSDPSTHTVLGNAYYDDFWKTLVEIAPSHAGTLQYPQDVQLRLPFATNPGRDDIPEVNQPIPNVSLQPIPTFWTSLPPSDLAFTQDISPTGIGFTAFPTPGWSPTYSELGVGFPDNLQDFSTMPSYSDVSSSMPDAMTSPTTPAPPSQFVDLLPFMPTSYEPAAQLGFFAPGQTTDFSDWCQSNTVF